MPTPRMKHIREPEARVSVEEFQHTRNEVDALRAKLEETEEKEMKGKEEVEEGDVDRLLQFAKGGLYTPPRRRRDIDPCLHNGVGRQYRRSRRLQKNIIKGQCFTNFHGVPFVTSANFQPREQLVARCFEALHYIQAGR